MAAQKSGDSEKKSEKEKFVQIDRGGKTRLPSRPEPERHPASGHPAPTRRSPVAQGTGRRAGQKCQTDTGNQEARVRENNAGARGEHQGSWWAPSVPGLLGLAGGAYVLGQGEGNYWSTKVKWSVGWDQYQNPATQIWQ